MKILRLAAGLLLAAALARPAAAQTLDPAFARPTGLYAPGQVYSIGPQQADGKRVVYGFFQRANGTTVGNLVRLDASGGLDVPFSQNVGQTNSVYCVKGLPSGQYLLGGGGSDVQAGGLVRTEALRLNADGTADASFDAGTGPAVGANPGLGADYAGLPGGKIIVGGYFDTFNGRSAKGLVRLNANGSVDTGFSVGTGVDVVNSPTGFSFVYAVLPLPNGQLLVGGIFGTFNGQPANHLVRLNANGSRDASFVPPFGANTYVEALVLQPNGNVLVSGNLTLPGAGGQAAALVRLLPTGGLDPGFSQAGLNSFSFASVGSNGYNTPVVLQPDGKVLLCGYFGGISTADFVARLNADGTLDNSFQRSGGPDGVPSAFGLEANGAVLVGGFFNSFGGRENPLGRLTATGAVDAAYLPVLQSAGSIAAAVRQADGKLLVGGDFTEMNGVAVRRVARLNANGTLDAPYVAATGLLPGAVLALTLQPDGRLLAGTTAGLRRLSAGGSLEAGFGANTYSPVTALAVQPDGKVLLGSNYFGAFSNSAYLNLVRVDGSSGNNDPTFVRTAATATGPGELISTGAILVQPDGRIVVGGFFDQGPRPSLGRVVRYEATGAYDPSFANNAAYQTTGNPSSQTNGIYALVRQPDGKLLVGGGFTAVDGTARPGLARLNANGTLDASFAPTRAQTGSVFALALQPNGRVLLGGSFSSPTPTPAYTRMARVLDNGQFDASFAPTANPNGTVLALLVQPDGAVVVAGSFSTVGGQPAAGLARITAPNVLAVAAPAAVAARTAAWPVPAHGLLHVLPDFSARPLTVELLDVLGRPVLALPAAPATETTLDVSTRAAGVYLLRVQYAAGAVVRRVVVE